MVLVLICVLFFNIAFCVALVHNDDSAVTHAVNDSPHEVATCFSCSISRVLNVCFVQVERRLLLLARALPHELQRPALVTICRSVRDGYAFSSHWRQIEDGKSALYQCFLLARSCECAFCSKILHSSYFLRLVVFFSSQAS
jgi:hypothetical protein